MKEYQACLEEAATRNKPFLEVGHLYFENVLLPRPKWFKGISERGLRGDIAA